MHDSQGWGQFHLINSNSFQFNLINSNSINFFTNNFFSIPVPVQIIQFQFQIKSMGVFPTQMHGIIVIVIDGFFVTEELLSKVIVIDHNVIDKSITFLLHLLLQIY